METELVDQVFNRAQRALAPPKKLLVSEWADQFRLLSSTYAAEPGKWRTARAAYQKGMLDCIKDATVETVVFMTSSQVGKSEVISNIIAYHIDHDPCPMLLVFPTLELAESWSKDRFANMHRDMPCLQERVSETRLKMSSNTLLHKEFPGGQLTLAGANSPASLSMRPIRLLLCDEVDRFPLSVGVEGDPVSIAVKRTNNFWNRKIILVSTPTVAGISRINEEWEKSDQRRFFVPCVHCGAYQILLWKNVKIDRENTAKSHLVCESCNKEINDAQKCKMVSLGEWRSTSGVPGPHKTAGFHVNELYSPWSSIERIVNAFLVAKKIPERLKTWVNTTLGECWEDEGEKIEGHDLAAREEPYAKDCIPEQIAVVTCGVDVQDNRIEIETVGWGLDFESWSLDYKVLLGDPGRLDVWRDLDTYLMKTHFKNVHGQALRINASCVDTGGHHTQSAYRFCGSRFVNRVYAIRGVGGYGRALISRPSRNNKAGVPLFGIAVDTAKEFVFTRLKIDSAGPGYCHFPVGYTTEYYNQLTSEKLVVKYVQGKRTQSWVKIRDRNEALDCRVYAVAAYELLNPDIAYILKDMQSKQEETILDDANEQLGRNAKPSRQIKLPRSNFVNRWQDG